SEGNGLVGTLSSQTWQMPVPLHLIRWKAAWAGLATAKAAAAIPAAAQTVVRRMKYLLLGKVVPAPAAWIVRWRRPRWYGGHLLSAAKPRLVQRALTARIRGSRAGRS